MDRLRKLANEDEPFLYVDSENLENEIDFIKKNDIRNICIPGYQEYKLHDVDWFSEIGKQIQSLIITPPSNHQFSFGGLKYCTELRRVRINNETNDLVDLSNNTKLRKLSLLNYKFAIGVEALSLLESLVLTNKTPSKLITKETFDGFKNLQTLTLQGVKLSKGLEFLKNSPIDRLVIFNSRKPSLKGLLDLNLSYLDIDRCKNIEKEELIYKLGNLKTLKLIDSVVVESADKFCELVNLEALVVMGTSYFIDGNFDCMKDRLLHFGFDNKRHYNIKYDEFKKFNLLSSSK
jgi:hypothetical protein